jgi:hypothetical protein
MTGCQNIIHAILHDVFSSFVALFLLQATRKFSLLQGWDGSALLDSCLQTCMKHTSAKCTVNELLMMGRGTARNM